jgi:hypothetical protein
MMLKRVMGLVAIGVLLLGGTPTAYGQKATEIFIPIGQSPGVSNKTSIVGTIETIDARAQTIVVAGSSKLECDDHRSHEDLAGQEQASLSSQKGTFTDLGRTLGRGQVRGDRSHRVPPTGSECNYRPGGSQVRSGIAAGAAGSRRE